MEDSFGATGLLEVDENLSRLVREAARMNWALWTVTAAPAMGLLNPYDVDDDGHLVFHQLPPNDRATAKAAIREQKQCDIDRIGELMLAVALPERQGDVDAIMAAVIRVSGAGASPADC